MPTPPGYAECSYRFEQTGLVRPAYVTFGIDPVDTDPAVIAGKVNTAFSDSGSLRTIIDSTVTMTGVRVSVGTDGTADLVYVLDTTVIGTNAGLASLPPNCAVLVRKTSTRGGRRGRGRMYIPWCVGEGNVDEAGVVATAQVASIQNAVTAWRVSMTTNQVPLVLLHGPGKTPAGPPDPVVGLVVDKLIATQRRRLGR